MKSFEYTITDPVGMHARPAGNLAKKVKEYQSKVVIVKGEKSAEAQKLMAVMGLGVKNGEKIIISRQYVHNLKVKLGIQEVD